MQANNISSFLKCVDKRIFQALHIPYHMTWTLKKFPLQRMQCFDKLFMISVLENGFIKNKHSVFISKLVFKMWCFTCKCVKYWGSTNRFLQLFKVLRKSFPFWDPTPTGGSKGRTTMLWRDSYSSLQCNK